MITLVFLDLVKMSIYTETKGMGSAKEGVCVIMFRLDFWTHSGV